MHPLNLTAKLKDTANASAPELSFQRKAVKDYHLCQAEVFQPSQPTENNNPPSLILDTHLHSPHSADTTSIPRAEQTFPSIANDGDVEDASAQSEQSNFF